MRELFRRVAGFKYATSLDLAAAFLQMPIKEQDKYITTFTWNSKRYQFNGAIFGMTHIPGRFQRLMTAILEEHLTYVLIYIDDVFIYSNTLEEHIDHCKKVIMAITNANLRIRREKCHVGYQECSLLGHIIDGVSLRIDRHKVSTFTSLKKPRTGKQLQAMLGFACY